MRHQEIISPTPCPDGTYTLRMVTAVTMQCMLYPRVTLFIPTTHEEAGCAVQLRAEETRAQRATQ